MFRSFRLPAFFAAATLVVAQAASAQDLPPPAARAVDFAKDLQPLLEASCVKCHAKGKEKGGLSIETREAFLKGGETGPAAEPGKSAESLAVEMVAGLDPDSVMPKKGKRWTPEQVGLLRAWIDQGMHWPEGITFAKPEPLNLHPRIVELPGASDAHPVDRVLAGYFAANQITPAPVVEDRIFARRAYLDVVGLLPTPAQLDAFLADPAPDKRTRLVRSLLADNRGYAEHWLTFWNDLLRNDYRGTGFIDGGRKQISEWLFSALLTNKRYDRFVEELVSPSEKSLGFSAGIIWRGTVPAAMTPPMQAAQSVSQVFLGVNLKCAACHDSFVNDWTLADAFGMAAVFSDDPLELVHCDKPTGKQAAMRFLYPQLGGLDAKAPRNERLKRFAGLMTSTENGRLARTAVNRLWARLLGRGLVEPTDDMEQPAWNPDLLDWLANDFAAHDFDLKHTLEVILTSRAYQLPAVEDAKEKEVIIFRGPLVRRLTAEQFADAASALTGEWARLPATLEFDWSGGAEGVFAMPRWLWTGETFETAARRIYWRHARRTADEAQKKSAEAQVLIERGAPEAAAAAEAAKAAAAEAARAANEAAGAKEPGRHRVIFRKTFTLDAKPDTAWATILGSQSFEVRVNDKEVKHRMSDGFRNGRVRLFDFAPHLVAGENVVAINIDSHTEKFMNDTERAQHPASVQHLNQTSGLAFYLRARSGETWMEVVSDESWHARRAPDGAWASLKYADADWALATLLADGTAPVDEGPGLEPFRRKDFANIPVHLGPALRAPVSTAALAGRVRASMLASDPLQAALDRPNREIVIPTRATAATTIQSLELTNGATLDALLKTAAPKLTAKTADAAASIDTFFRHAIARPPSDAERQLALELLGTPIQTEGVADFLWALTMLPEFQFLH